MNQPELDTYDEVLFLLTAEARPAICGAIAHLDDEANVRRPLGFTTFDDDKFKCELVGIRDQIHHLISRMQFRQVESEVTS